MGKDAGYTIADFRPKPRQNWQTELFSSAAERLTGRQLTFHPYGDLQEGYREFLQTVASVNQPGASQQDVKVYSMVLDKVAGDRAFELGLRRPLDTEDEKAISKLVVMKEGLVNLKK